MKQFTVTVKGEEVTFESPHETLDDAIEAIKASGNRSQFALDIVTKHERFGLSDKQAAWAHRLATQPPPLTLGLTNIAPMLRNLPGKKRPKLQVADGVQVTLNSDKSKNPGHVTVTDGGPDGDNQYFGRIDPDSGTVYPGRDFTDEVMQALVAFNNQNPQEESNEDFDDIPF